MVYFIVLSFMTVILIVFCVVFLLGCFMKQVRAKVVIFSILIISCMQVFVNEGIISYNGAIVVVLSLSLCSLIYIWRGVVWSSLRLENGLVRLKVYRSGVAYIIPSVLVFVINLDLLGLIDLGLSCWFDMPFVSFLMCFKKVTECENTGGLCIHRPAARCLGVCKVVYGEDSRPLGFLSKDYLRRLELVTINRYHNINDPKKQFGNLYIKQTKDDLEKLKSKMKEFDAVMNFTRFRFFDVHNYGMVLLDKINVDHFYGDIKGFSGLDAKKVTSVVVVDLRAVMHRFEPQLVLEDLNSCTRLTRHVLRDLEIARGCVNILSILVNNAYHHTGSLSRVDFEILSSHLECVRFSLGNFRKIDSTFKVYRREIKDVISGDLIGF